jgi:hypothetical protein
MSNLEDEIGIEETALLLSREVFPDARTLAKCIPSPHLYDTTRRCALCAYPRSECRKRSKRRIRHTSTRTRR